MVVYDANGYSIDLLRCHAGEKAFVSSYAYAFTSFVSSEH